jgi:hypothetical protein
LRARQAYPDPRQLRASARSRSAGEDAYRELWVMQGKLYGHMSPKGNHLIAEAVARDCCSLKGALNFR